MGYGNRNERRNFKTGGGYSRPTPKVITAPYTFVPLSEHVVDSSNTKELQAERISQDVPFSDALRGTVSVELTAETPLFIRGTADKESFFEIKGRGKAVPGSSLRGMVRNVVEIAGFGRMRRVNRHKYGLRDLHNRDLYRQYMAEIIKGVPTPLVCAGWLTRNTGPNAKDCPVIIHKASFAKIHYDLLEQLASERHLRFEPGKKQRSPQKYQVWEGKDRRVKVSVKWHTGPGKENPSNVPRDGYYGKVTALGGQNEGTLVFTGQPQNWDKRKTTKRKGAGNPKQHDFVFFDDDGEQEVSKELWEDFLFVHRGTGEQHRLEDNPNEELAYLFEQARFRDEDARNGEPNKPWDKGIPVFYLLEPGPNGTAPVIRAIGLAMMFRLAYRNSTKDGVEKVQGKGRDQDIDLAEAIFGRVPSDGQSSGALKGRVVFSHGSIPTGVKDLGRVEAVLGTPKASYYPNYVEQRNSSPGESPASVSGKPKYKTWMDHDVHVRGWKRYWPQEKANMNPALPAKASDKVKSFFRPIDLDGRKVRFKMRVHNLRPFELGALLWALDFGGDEKARHMLGMAKNLGFGRVRLRVSGNTLRNLHGEPYELDEARAAFVQFMEEKLGGGWENSLQIRALRNAANPEWLRDEDKHHMSIAHPSLRNEFSGAKQAGLALPVPLGNADLQGAKEHPIHLESDVGKARAPRSVPVVSQKKPKHEVSEPTDPDEADRKELEAAKARGEHMQVIQRWIKEAGDRADTRRCIAKKLVKMKKMLKKKYPKEAEWMRGCSG